MELLPGMNKKPKLTIANVFDRDNAKKGLAKNLSFGMTQTSENAKKDIEKNTVIIENPNIIFWAMLVLFLCTWFGPKCNTICLKYYLYNQKFRDLVLLESLLE